MSTILSRHSGKNGVAAPQSLPTASHLGSFYCLSPRLRRVCESTWLKTQAVTPSQVRIGGIASADPLLAVGARRAARSQLTPPRDELTTPYTHAPPLHTNPVRQHSAPQHTGNAASQHKFPGQHTSPAKQKLDSPIDEQDRKWLALCFFAFFKHFFFALPDFFLHCFVASCSTSTPAAVVCSG